MNKKNLHENIKKALNHEGIMRYGKNISWLMLERLIRTFVGFFVSIWIARYLEPVQYGVLSYAQSYVYLFAVIATLGLDNILVRELVENHHSKNRILGTAFFLKLTASFIIFPLMYLSVHIFNNDNNVDILIYIIALSIIFQSFNVIDGYYQSIVQSKYVVIANLVTMTLSSLIKIILITNNASLIVIAIAYSIDGAFIAMMLVIFYMKKSQQKLFHWSIDISTIKYLISQSAPMWLSGLMIAIYAKTDQLMIMNMVGSQELGFYAAAAKLNDLWSFIPLIICSSVLPAIINAKSISEKIYLKRINYLYSLMIWLSIFILIFGSILSTQIISLSFGQEYLKAIATFKLLLWSNIFVFFFTAWARFIIVERQQKLFFYFDLLSVITNIILNFILIPEYGIKGAALATVLSVPIVHLLIFIFWKKQRYILQSFFRSLLLNF